MNNIPNMNNMNNMNDIHKFMLIKRDVRELRQIIFGNDIHIHDWDRILIVYSLFFMYQHMFLVYNLMNTINRNKDFDFNRDYLSLFMFVFLIANLRTSYLYMIKSVYSIDKKLAGNLHMNMGEYFEL